MTADGSPAGHGVSGPPQAEPTEHTHVWLALWVVPLLCAIVVPGLIWVVSERPLAIRFEQAKGMSVGIALLAVLFLAILTRGFRTRWRWALGVTAVAMLVLFQWPTLTFAGRHVAAALPIPLIEDVFPVMMAIGFVWVSVRLGGEWPFAAILSTGLLIMVVVLVTAALPFAEIATPEARGTATPGSPDVVLVILDGYTREDVLREQFDHDNGAFQTSLEELGFNIAEAANANYSFTYASISSMYDLDYVYETGVVDQAANSRMRSALSGAPDLFDTFRGAGYEIAFAENAWGGSQCGGAVDVCIRDGFAERMIWSLSEVTIFAPLVRAVRPHPFHSVSVEHLEMLPEFIERDRTEGLPRLTVAHILLPHPPFLRDASCQYVNTPVRRAFTSPSEDLIENRRRFYADQLECTNSMVAEAVAAVVARRPDTLIMITGDHGSGSTRLANVEQEDWPDEAIHERMSLFSAYRLPGCEASFYPTISPVNGARELVNCAIDDELERLPDRTLWAPPMGEGIVRDVAHRLAGQP